MSETQQPATKSIIPSPTYALALRATSLVERGLHDIIRSEEYPLYTPEIERLVNDLLIAAVREGASEIRIEPDAAATRVLYRVKGQFHEKMSLPRKVHPELINRIKIMGWMDISEHRIYLVGGTQNPIVIGGQKLDLIVMTMSEKYREDEIAFEKEGCCPRSPGLDKWGQRAVFYLVTAERRAFGTAAIKGDSALIGEMLAQEPSMASDALYNNGGTALFAAAYWGRIETVRMLIRHGADVNARDLFNRTPCHKTVSGALQRTDRWDVQLGTPLDVFEAIIDLLVHNGAEINAQTCRGLTPLHFAVGIPNEYVAVLLRRGADVNHRDCCGRTPFDKHLEPHC